jgi:hypothetical protein
MSFDEDPRNDEPIDREEWEKAMSPKPPESDASPTKKVMCPYCKHDDCIYTGDDVWYCNKCDKGHFESKASRLEQLEAIVRELANMIRPHFSGVSTNDSDWGIRTVTIDGSNGMVRRNYRPDSSLP